MGSKIIQIDENKIKVMWTCCGCVLPTIHTLDYDPTNNKPKCPDCGSVMSYVQTMINKPRIIIFKEGGVVHDVMSDTQMDLRILDYDVEGADSVDKIILPGSDNETEVVIDKYDLDGVEEMDDFFDQEAINGIE